MTTITERVTAGAAFLDEHDPEWWKADVPNAINLDTLNLRHGDKCVLGQRCPLEHGDGSYAKQVERLTGQDAARVLEWAVACGFILPPGRALGPWDDLTLAWWVLINERRKLAADGAA